MFGTMDNQGMLPLNDANYQAWKDTLKSRLRSPGYDILQLICNGYTKTPPSSQEL